MPATETLNVATSPPRADKLWGCSVITGCAHAASLTRSKRLISETGDDNCLQQQFDKNAHNLPFVFILAHYIRIGILSPTKTCLFESINSRAVVPSEIVYQPIGLTLDCGAKGEKGAATPLSHCKSGGIAWIAASHRGASEYSLSPCNDTQSGVAPNSRLPQ